MLTYAQTATWEDNEATIEVAARWLDETYPGWAATIDVENFEIENPEMCIGHYLNVDWYADLSIPFREATGYNKRAVFADEGYQDHWINEILARS